MQCNWQGSLKQNNNHVTSKVQMRDGSEQSMTYRYREFFIFFVVSEKFGTGKKSRNRYRKNLVPEKVSEPVSEKFGTGKKVPVSVSKIFSIGKKYRYRYRPTFWVPSHTASN